MNLRDLVPSELTHEGVETLLIAYRDPGLVSAAQQAANNLGILFSRLNANDLIRLVAGGPDAEQWVRELGTSAQAALAGLTEERVATKATMEADAATRQSLDVAAMELLAESQGAAASSLSAAAAAESETLAFRQQMIGAGLAVDEIDRIVADRVAQGQPVAQAHRASAAASQAALAQLTAFLADPLRRRDRLDEVLLAALHERSGAPAMREAFAAAVQDEAMVSTIRRSVANFARVQPAPAEAIQSAAA